MRRRNNLKIGILILIVLTLAACSTLQPAALLNALVSTTPPDGGEIAPNGTLTMQFEKRITQPVFVNGKKAGQRGEKQAVWQMPPGFAGQLVTLKISWGSALEGDFETIELTVSLASEFKEELTTEIKDAEKEKVHFNLDVRGNGQVSVNPPGTSCGPAELCAFQYSPGESVILAALAGFTTSGNVGKFTGWFFDCDMFENEPYPTLTMDTDKFCEAEFTP